MEETQVVFVACDTVDGVLPPVCWGDRGCAGLIVLQDTDPPFLFTCVKVGSISVWSVTSFHDQESRHAPQVYARRCESLETGRARAGWQDICEPSGILQGMREMTGIFQAAACGGKPWMSCGDVADKLGASLGQCQINCFRLVAYETNPRRARGKGREVERCFPFLWVLSSISRSTQTVVEESGVEREILLVTGKPKYIDGVGPFGARRVLAVTGRAYRLVSDEGWAWP